MPTFPIWPGLCLAITLLGAALPSQAGGDHDHGAAAPAATGAGLPRFAAISESFELVGVLDGRQLTLYLDRFADNTPVRGAQIEIEIAGTKLAAAPQGDDAYQVTLQTAPPAAVLPVTAAITAGTGTAAETDLLAGELDLHADETHAHADEAAPARPWWHLAGGAAAALAVVTALLRGGRRLLASRQARHGAAA